MSHGSHDQLSLLWHVWFGVSVRRLENVYGLIIKFAKFSGGSVLSLDRVDCGSGVVIVSTWCRLLLFLCLALKGKRSPD